MHVLDTDVLIDIQRGHAPAIVWFASLSAIPSIPGFVVMELTQDSQNKQQVRKALQLVAPLPVIWPTEADCARALSDFTVYHLSHKVGLIDALIASCAVGRSATLCTFNVKQHYRVIPNLHMEQPYSR
jgi:predicted nucleic acid-binding protein